MESDIIHGLMELIKGMETNLQAHARILCAIVSMLDESQREYLRMILQNQIELGESAIPSQDSLKVALNMVVDCVIDGDSASRRASFRVIQGGKDTEPDS